jgi:multiple sugar transport system permease protein
MENVGRRKYTLKDIIRDPKAWRNSPAYDSTVHKWKGKIKDFIVGICIAIIVVGVCYVILSPIIGVTTRAFMTREDAINPLVFIIPTEPTTQNVQYAVQYMDYFIGPGLKDIEIGSFNLTAAVYDFVGGTPIYGALNFMSRVLSGALPSTVSFALVFSLLHVLVCSMVGYGFARFKYPGVNALFALVIITIVVPVHSYMIPMYLNFRYFSFFNINFC